MSNLRTIIIRSCNLDEESVTTQSSNFVLGCKKLVGHRRANTPMARNPNMEVISPMRNTAFIAFSLLAAQLFLVRQYIHYIQSVCSICSAYSALAEVSR